MYPVLQSDETRGKFGSRNFRQLSWKFSYYANLPRTVDGIINADIRAYARRVAFDDYRIGIKGKIRIKLHAKRNEMTRGWKRMDEFFPFLSVIHCPFIQ